MQTDAQRRRRLALVGAVLVALIAAVAVAIAVSSGGGSSNSTSGSSGSTSSAAAGSSQLKGVADVQAEFAGIPQTGNVLGNPNAKGTMMVFADLQCPFCADFENTAMAALVKKYVRPGKLKIIFQPIVIIGNDSILGARAAAAAGQQQKLFQYVATLYRNQGQENSGYLNQAYVKKIGAAAGLNVSKLVADLKAPAVEKLLGQAQSSATSAHVNSTPTFFVAKSGQTLQQLAVTTFDPSAFYGRLDQATR